MIVCAMIVSLTSIPPLPKGEGYSWTLREIFVT